MFKKGIEGFQTENMKRILRRDDLRVEFKGTEMEKQRQERDKWI